jgi:hypothetical protein
MEYDQMNKYKCTISKSFIIYADSETEAKHIARCHVIDESPYNYQVSCECIAKCYRMTRDIIMEIGE